MAVKLNRSGFNRAKALIGAGKALRDDRDAWSEHQPSAAEENEFIQRHGWSVYGQWHLGADDEKDKETKAHYKFPYGDFIRVHRCAVLTAESRAGQYKYADIERAAARLHEMIDPGKHRQKAS